MADEKVSVEAWKKACENAGKLHHQLIKERAENAKLREALKELTDHFYKPNSSMEELFKKIEQAKQLL